MCGDDFVTNTSLIRILCEKLPLLQWPYAIADSMFPGYFLVSLHFCVAIKIQLTCGIQSLHTNCHVGRSRVDRPGWFLTATGQFGRPGLGLGGECEEELPTMDRTSPWRISRTRWKPCGGAAGWRFRHWPDARWVPGCSQYGNRPLWAGWW